MARTVQTNFGKKLTGFFAIIFLLALVALALEAGLSRALRFFELENRTYDWRVQLASKFRSPDPRIKLILIDQAALDARAREGVTWPWPRSMYVPVLEFLHAGGAKGAAFDIIFTETSYIGQDEDVALAEAVGSGFPVVSAMVLSNSDQRPSDERLAQFAERQREIDARTSFSTRWLASQRGLSSRGAVVPVPELLAKSPAFGNVNADPDSDGVFRHYVPGGFIGSIPVLNLPFALYELTSGASDPRPAEWLAPFFDRENRLTVQFQGPQDTYDSVSMDTIINAYVDMQEGKEPRVDPDRYKDSWVIIGVTAPALLDLRPTPLAERFNGVEYLANVLDNIVNRKFIREAPIWFTLLITIAVLAILLWVVLFERNVFMQAVLLPLTFFAFYLVSWSALVEGWWLPVASPTLAMATALVLGFSLQYRLEDRQSRFLKNAFQFYVSPSVIDKLIEDPARLSLGGEKRELTMFFSDIQGFTSISERLDAVKLVSFLNIYLSIFTDIILKSGGTVDKYVGDAVVAFWNAPLPIEDHALRAVRSAMECQRVLDEMRAELKAQFGVDVYGRIGLNTDVVSVGNFGSKMRFNYTMIGDGANLASRLEGVNKAFGLYILISESTYEAVKHAIVCRRVADIQVVGKLEAIRTYTPVGELGSETLESHAAHDAALALFDSGRRGEALEAFRALLPDPIAKSYVKRLEKELDVPDSEWNPVWKMTEK